MPRPASADTRRQALRYLTTVAETAFQDGHFRTAAVLWQTTVAAERGAKPLSVHRLGSALERLGHHAPSAALAMRLRRTHTEHAWGTRTVVRHLLSQGRHLEARRICAAMLAAPSVSLETKCRVAVLLSRAGDVTGAFNFVDGQLDSRPAPANAAHAAISLAVEYGHFQKALSLLEEPVSQDRLPRDIVASLARVNRALQRFSDCERICMEGLARFPGDPELLYHWSSSAHAQENWLAAYRRWRTLLRVDPSRLEGWLKIAYILEQRGHCAYAERLLRSLVVRFPHSNQPRRSLAHFYHSRGMHTAAERCFVLVRCADRVTVESEIDEANFLAEIGRTREANEIFARLSLRSGADFRVLRAMAISGIGPERSEVLLRRAVLVNEGDYESWVHLARLLVRRGDLAEAQRHLIRMRQLFGDRVDHFRAIAAEVKQASPLAHTLMLARSLRSADDTTGISAFCATLLDQHRFNEARALVHRLERQRSKTASRFQVEILIKQNRLREAFNLAASVLHDEPWNASAREHIAEVLVRFGRYHEVRILLVETHARYPQRLQGLVQAITKASWAAGDKLLTLMVQQMAVGRFARSRHAELGLGRTLRALSKNELALSLFQRLQTDFPRQIDISTDAGVLLLRLDRKKDGAGTLHTAALDRPIAVSGWLNLALAKLVAGDSVGVSSALQHVQPGAPMATIARVVARHAAELGHTGEPSSEQGKSADTETAATKPERCRQLTYRNEQPFVAVVVSAYHASQTIEASLDSILTQSYKNLQVVVVDDCSTDDTVAKVEGLCGRDARVKLYRLGTNQGTYVARNVGIGLTDASYITFQDADDWSVSERLEMQMDCLRSSNVLCVYGTYYRVSEDGSLDARAILPAQRDFAMAPVTAFMRRGLLRSIGYFDSVRIGADMEHYHRVRLAHGAGATAVIRRPLLMAGSREGSLTNNLATGHDWRFMARAPLVYERNYKMWHAKCVEQEQKPFMAFPLGARPFSVPRAFLP